jgi:hypothetical protein|tara:strand:+ start:202 stop:480 length:279 start_codon:yes stop_codon:yes gene_type:complete
MPGELTKNMQKALKNIKISDMTKVKEIEMDPELVKIAKEMGKKIQKKAMGGEIMDTTKSMPADMMGGGKVKPMKMKMGGVIPGRGGMFKGVK